MSTDTYIGIGIVIFVLGLFGTIAISSHISEARYYECVYTLKGVAYSPADIQVLCKR